MESWFQRDLPESIQLPGVLQAQGFGDEISTNTPWVLSLYDRNWFLREDYLAYVQPGSVKVPFVCQPPRHYLGLAWYQREVEVPSQWAGRRLVLFLERPRWETIVWWDGVPMGTNDSLCAPHEFDLGLAGPGKHRLTIRVNNGMLMSYRPDAHAVSDSLGSTWNGITGAIELRSTPLVWIDEARVFPDVTNQAARILVRIGNATRKSGSGWLRAGEVSKRADWDSSGGRLEIQVPLGSGAQLWDEYNPAIQRLALRLEGQEAGHEIQVAFGLREFRASGRQFTINGRPTWLRGTHHGGDFPLTGYPPADVDYWRKLFRTCKEWGLNHVRFHSFCPNEAAFTAADEEGIYLQVEPGMWNEISPGTAMERMLYKETDRILRAYGNHPSFVLFSASNEPKGRWKESLPRWVEHYRAEDPRHLYTTGTGWSLINAPGPVTGADFLAVHRIGQNMLRGNIAWFGRDYRRSLRGVNVPVIAHEVGQWCAYPDFDVIGKFQGYARPGNYEIFRDSAAAHGVLGMNREFAQASGRFQLACYKEDIEANLRTPGMSGFQLLDLHDYTGQGTALVGLLDPFWEQKGYVTAREFREFCSATVPFVWLHDRVFTVDEPFEAWAEVSHYGSAPIKKAQVSWNLTDPVGKEVGRGAWKGVTIQVGSNTPLGAIRMDLSKLVAPAEYRLTVSIAGTPHRNSWNFWLFPKGPEPEPEDVLVTSTWEKAEASLAAGGKVLFLPKRSELYWDSPLLDSVPIFWNRYMSPGWARMLGIWCDTHHPALAGFPTRAHCDWQWTEMLRRARAINLDTLPRELQPVVQAIDDWNRNWKLGLVFECRVGTGRLVVCSIDLRYDLDKRPAARQLRQSLLAYMQTGKFQPSVSLPPEQLRGLWFDTLVMQELGAQVQARGADAEALVDGDPNTYWSAGGTRSREERSHPYEIGITFPSAIEMNGLVLVNRQNDRDHRGDIRGYRLEASSDGNEWTMVMAGELASTWAPQRLLFPQRVTAQHLRLTALSGFGADGSAALAELAVLAAGGRVGEGRDVEYQRIRSTATDVDEGNNEAAPKSEAPE